MPAYMYLRACLHGGGGTQVGGVTRLSILSLILIWSRGVTRHVLPHLSGVPHLHVNQGKIIVTTPKIVCQLGNDWTYFWNDSWVQAFHNQLYPR